MTVKKLDVCVPVAGTVPVQFLYRYLRLVSFFATQPIVNFAPSFSSLIPLEAARNALARNAV